MDNNLPLIVSTEGTRQLQTRRDGRASGTLSRRSPLIFGEALYVQPAARHQESRRDESLEHLKRDLGLVYARASVGPPS